MGTPAYMAPEQVEGREPASAADLFSLGLVLYEMAVGRLPFPGASLGQMLSSGSQSGGAGAVARACGCSRRSGWPGGEASGKGSSQTPAIRVRSSSRLVRAGRSAGRSASTLPVASRLRHPRGLASSRDRCRTLPPVQGATHSQPPIPNPATYTQLTSFTDSASPPGPLTRRSHAGLLSE